MAVIWELPSCICLSPMARNYELEGIHFNMLLTFHGLGSKDTLAFIREFYTTCFNRGRIKDAMLPIHF